MSVEMKESGARSLWANRNPRVVLGVLLSSLAIAGCGESQSNDDVQQAASQTATLVQQEMCQAVIAVDANCDGIPDSLPSAEVPAPQPQPIGGTNPVPYAPGSVQAALSIDQIMGNIESTEQSYSDSLRQSVKAEEQATYEYDHSDQDYDGYMNMEDPLPGNPSVYPGNDPNSPDYYAP